MHVVIINGSPRVRKHSNTEKILDSFVKGLEEKGVTYERYAVSERSSWDEIREAYIKNEEILIALPLFVECMPGLLLEFMETLPQKDENTRMSFLLQGGFAEGCQFRCGEEFLEKMPEYLGVRYGGTLVKGDNFGIRVANEEQQKKITKPFQAMGELFADENGFFSEKAAKFTGPERFSAPVRMMFQFVFKTFAKNSFKKVADEWGCVDPIDAKPWR